MKKYFLLFLVIGFLVGCSQEENANQETEEKKENESSVVQSETETENKVELSEENDEESIQETEASTNLEEDISKKDVTVEASESEETNQNQSSKEKDEAEQNDDSTTSIDSDFIKENITNGMTESDILALLGEADAKGVDAMEGYPSWRYDIGAPIGYEVEESGEGLVDTIDVESIKNQTIDMQVFIGWDNGLVRTVSCTYLKDGQIITYHLLEDGFQKEDIY